MQAFELAAKFDFRGGWGSERIVLFGGRLEKSGDIWRNYAVGIGNVYFETVLQRA